MLNLRMFLPLFSLVILFTLFNSCDKDIEEPQGLHQEVSPTDNNQGGFLGLVSAQNQEENNTESGTETEEDCFTLNYPITIGFPDGTTQQVNSDEELDTLIDIWFENNEDVEEYPEIQFPITVTLEDGSTQTVNDDEELCDLFFECYGDEEWEDDEEWEIEEDCFTIVYPIVINGPEGEVTINSDEELDAFFEDQEEDDFDFDFVYPIDVVLEDGNTLTLNNDEELDTLFEECYGEYEDDCEEDFSLEDCFEPVYPVSFTLGDGTVATVNNDEELYVLFDELDDEDDLEVNYPIEVILVADGSTVTVNNDEELDAVIEDCE